VRPRPSQKLGWVMIFYELHLTVNNWKPDIMRYVQKKKPLGLMPGASLKPFTGVSSSGQLGCTDEPRIDPYGQGANIDDSYPEKGTIDAYHSTPVK
jgi:hypothetical protein